MRYVVEVEKGPPTTDLQQFLVEHVGTETVETIMSWAQQLREEGREEGLRLGQVSGARRVLLRLVATRFGAIPEPVAEAIAHATFEQIEAWTEQLLTAQSPEAVVRSDLG